MTEEDFRKAIEVWQAAYFTERGWLTCPSNISSWREFSKAINLYATKTRKEMKLEMSDSCECTMSLDDGKVTLPFLAVLLEAV